MAKPKKKKSSSPRRRSLKRAARLRSARKWLASFKGTNVVRGYAQWFGVDVLCAAKELQMLGVEIGSPYRQRLQSRLDSRNRKRQQKRADLFENDCIESDENFSYIVGYTSGGMPYGVPWDDHEDL
jgi:hypothetical protein